MSAIIQTAVIGSDTVRQLVLVNSTYACQFNFLPSEWSTMRVGFGLALEDTGANIGASLYIGWLANPAAGIPDGPLSATTTNFRGKLRAGATFTRAAGPPAYYSVGLYDGVRVGNVSTTTDLATYRISATPNLNRTMMLVMLNKSGTSHACTVMIPSAVGSQNDVSTRLQSGCMAVTSMASSDEILNANVIPLGYANGSSPSKTVDEAANGYLNSFCIAWSGASKLYITGINIQRMA